MEEQHKVPVTYLVLGKRNDRTNEYDNAAAYMRAKNPAGAFGAAIWKKE